ncbi:MAG: hypothetical protein ACLU9S_04515 [Oscillospiraceae bacterium]
MFHITKSGYLDTNAGSITDNVLNEGKFFPRQISGEVINEGEIIRGSFSGKVKNRGSINYGSFGEVENALTENRTMASFMVQVTNHGEIAGCGSFTARCDMIQMQPYHQRREFYRRRGEQRHYLLTASDYTGAGESEQWHQSPAAASLARR